MLMALKVMAAAAGASANVPLATIHDVPFVFVFDSYDPGCWRLRERAARNCT
jgi:hypothetical protein